MEQVRVEAERPQVLALAFDDQARFRGRVAKARLQAAAERHDDQAREPVRPFGQRAVAARETYGLVAVDGDGIIHVIWATGIDVPESSSLYYGRIDPVTKKWIEKGLLRTGAGGQVDPAKLYTDPKTGDIWLLYTDFATNGNEEVYLRHRKKGRTVSAFDAPVRLTTDANPQHYADAAFATDGTIHCVCVSENADTNSLIYLVYDPASATVTSRKTLNYTCLGDWARVALLLDNWNYAYLVWEDNNQLKFTTNLPVKNGARGWGLYE
jgi:hypothetical protein